METFRALIERCGGAAKLARELNIPALNVRMWKQRDNIPAEYWLDVVRASQRLGVQGVSAEELAKISSGRREAA